MSSLVAYRPTVISLFAGAGGLDLGLDSVGFETILQTDIDLHSCVTLQWGRAEAHRRGLELLQRSTVVPADIGEVDARQLLGFAQVRPGDVDVLAGGPPCQAFSVFGRRKGSGDPRGQLVYEYLRLLAAVRPRTFVFENVYGLLSIEGGRIFEEVCDRLASPGRGLKYQLSIHRVDAVDYGVPQFRDRIFIIGDSEGRSVDVPGQLTSKDAMTLGRPLPAWRTVRDAFRGLREMDSSVPNHTGRVHSERIITRYGSLVAGQRDPRTRINKLDLSRPSFTIIVGSDKGGGKGHVHPLEPREVTSRESARIQTFPDWWRFSGTSRHPIRQVGNAVPPLLAASVGAAIGRQLFEIDVPSIDEVLNTLGQNHLFPDAEDLLLAQAAWSHTTDNSSREAGASLAA
jgi:DNA (cytosine-5)-methyltransferase 1